MNYTTYKIKSKIKICFEKITEKFFDIIFFVPRYVYKNSPKFRNHIKESENKSYRKSRVKKLSKDIFRELDKREKILILDGYGSEDSFCDWSDSYCNVLLEDEKWIKKNKLVVEKYFVRDYASIYYKDRFEEDSMYRIYVNYYKDDEDVMYIVTKLKTRF